MRHVRILGLCLVAVMALAAFTASSSFAGAEFGKCEAKAGGKYSDANCTVKAHPSGSGSYEWRKGSELSAVKFTGANSGSGGVLYTDFEECNYSETGGFRRITRQACHEDGSNGVANNHGELAGERSGPYLKIYVECQSESSDGETVGKSEVAHVHVKFKGCKALGQISCENAGPEEIVTEELKGKLGYISKANHEPGILLEPAKHKGTFAHFDCPELGISTEVGVGSKKEGAAWVQGTKYPSDCTGVCYGATPEEEKHGGYDGIISPIKPANQMTSTYTQEYKIVEPEGCPHNVPSAFEKKHIDVLEDYGYLDAGGPSESTMWSCAGEEITNVNTLQPAGEEGEIKA